MRLRSLAGLLGSLAALGATALYLSLIASERNDPATDWAPWAAAFGACGVLALCAAFSSSARVRLGVFAGTAATLLALGVLSIFSIGLVLIASGVLLAIAAADASRGS